MSDAAHSKAHLVFRRAVVLAGGQSATKDVVGYTQQYISKLLKQGRVCPAGWVLDLEAATGVSRHELRPDLYPTETTSPTGRTDATTSASPDGNGASTGTAIPTSPGSGSCGRSAKLHRSAAA